MKIKLFSCMAFAMLLFNACSKDQHKVETTSFNETLKYKIDPKKLAEFRDIQLALKNGQNLRIAEETLSKEEFYLYAEALLNSVFTNFHDVPELLTERDITIPSAVEDYSLSSLFAFIADAENQLEATLADVTFDEEIQGQPYIHLIDVIWGDQLSLFVLIGANVSSLPNFFTFNMTSINASLCDRMALNGFLQQGIINVLNTVHINWEPRRYRPNVLFNSLWNPSWTHNYIPAYTFTEIESKTLDFQDPLDRQYYQTSGTTPQMIWHRVVPENTLPPCIPDILPGTTTQTAGLFFYSNTYAALATMLNPNQYNYWGSGGSTNGLVIVGLSIQDRNELSDILQTGTDETREFWHRVTFSYGRQIIIGEELPIGNE